MKNKLLGLLGVDKLIDNIQHLVEVRVNIIKNELQEKVAEGLAKVLPLIFLLLSLSIFLIFASITLAFYLSGLFESLVYGFGTVALLYLIITVIFFLLKDSESLINKFKSEIKKRS